MKFFYKQTLCVHFFLSAKWEKTISTVSISNFVLNEKSKIILWGFNTVLHIVNKMLFLN